MEKFGRLTAIEPTEKRKWGFIVWKCQCDCGNNIEIDSASLKRGNTKSCGCLHIESARKQGKLNYKHGHKLGESKTYNSWYGMKQRCYYFNHNRFKHYGGRGIKVCERWKNSFENFLADMGERPEGLTLDRIDNDKDYTPENCKWSTFKEQNNNRGKFNEH